VVFDEMGFRRLALTRGLMMVDLVETFRFGLLMAGFTVGVGWWRFGVGGCRS
jgi:hypothetical protein